MPATDPVQAVMEVLGCKKRRDLIGTAFCGKHHFGWLHDVNACPRAERAAEAAVATARPLIAAETLREAADDVQQIDGRRDDAARDWLRARADDLEAGR